MIKSFVTYLLIILAATAFADTLGTVYVHLDLESASTGVGTEVRFDAIVDSIRSETGGTLYCASPCLQEYQSFRLHSLIGRPLVDIDIDTICNCTGSPCYRSFYTHSSPFDLDRELVARACYFLASDSLDSACVFLRSEYSFVIQAYRPGNTEISMTERYTTIDLDEFYVVSDTVILSVAGMAMDCVPLKSPQCVEVYDLTPLTGKGIWHHVMLHDGYQYWVSTSPSPPAGGIDIDTNYIELEDLIPETSYYLHIRAWANCESSGRSYSDWTSTPFNTLPQPITTIKTSPLDLRFWADSVLYSTTQEFNWPYEGESGPCHWLEAVSPQFGAPAPIYIYRDWSDGGGFYHCHTVGPTNTTITCYFDSLDAGFSAWTPPPPTVCAGSVIPVSITMLNTGSLEWNEWDGIALGSQNPPLNTIWGLSAVPFDSGRVDPGEAFTFEFEVIAPDSPGVYVFEWELIRLGVDFFGERTDSALITVVSRPDAEASNGGPYCENETVELFGGPDGMTSYNWTGPGGFSSTERNPVLGSGDPSMTGDYTVVVTNADGCLDSAITTLTVNPKPYATASNTGPYCAGQTIELLSGPDGMAFYEWSGPLGFSSSDRNPGIIGADTSNSGIYTVIVTSIAGCVDTASTDVVVNEKPNVIANTNAPVCEGELLEFWSEPDGLDSYYWHLPGGGIIPGQNLYRHPATPDMAGLYYVVGTNSFGCADTSFVMAIIDTVLRTLTIDSVTADSYFISEGSVTELHCYVSGAAGDVYYSWLPTTALLFPDSSDPLAGPNVTTTYTVTVTDTQRCGVYSISDSITITVFSDFVCRIYIDSITHDATICAGDSVQLYVNTSLEAGYPHYLWSPNLWLSSTSIQNPVALPESSITYTVIVEDDSGCADTGAVSITVVDIQIDIEPDSGHICLGDEIYLYAEAVGGIPPYSYEWSPTGSVLMPDSAETPAFPETTTTYSVCVEDSFGCSACEYVTVRVDTVIESMTIEVSADDSDLIIGESTRLYVIAHDAEGVIGYDWSPAGYLDSPTSPNPWATPPVSCWFIVTVTDYQGVCEYSIIDSVFIYVEDTTSCPLHIIDITENTHICRGDSVPLFVSVAGSTGTVHYSWTPGGSLSDPNIPNPIAFPNTSTTYWIAVTDDSCADTGHVRIYVDTIATTMEIIAASAVFDTIDLGDSTIIYGDITGVSGDLSVHWSPEASLDNPDSAITWAHPTEPTTYTLIAADSQLCGIHYDTAYVHIHVVTWFGCSLFVEAYGADSICSGENAVLSAISTGGVGDVEYSWTPIEGLSSPNSPVTDASPETTMVYTVAATDDSGCYDYASVTVWVKTIDTSALPELSICSGDSLELPLSMQAGFEPIDWDWSPTDWLDNPLSASPVCYAETSIVYTVTATDDEFCSDTVLIAISVDSVQTGMSVVLSPDTSIYFGGSANLRAEILAASGSVGFEWSPTSWLDDPFSLTPVATPPARIVYYFTAMDSQACGVYTVADSIIVDVIPGFECSLSVTPAFVETTLCRGGSVILETSISHATGTVGYLWEPPTYLDDPYSPNPVASDIDSTIYYMVTVIDDSCADTATVLVNITRVNLAVADSYRICRGDTVLLGATMENPTEPVIWNWLPLSGLSNPDSDYTLAYPDNSIIYKVIGRDDSDCTDSAFVYITVDTVVTSMDIAAVASPENISPGDSALLTVLVIGSSGEISILWSGPGTIADSTANITWAFPTDSCWFYVTVSDSQACGVFTLIDSAFVGVGIDPCSIVVHVSGGDTICRGDSVTLHANADSANGSVVWLWRPGHGLDDSTSQNPKASPEMTTHYWAIGIDTLGCADSANVVLAVLEPPIAVAYAADDSFEVGDDIELVGLPNFPDLGYYWHGPDGFETTDRCFIIEDADTSDSGWYILTVTNIPGCSGSDSVYIAVLPVPRVPDIEVSPTILYFDLYEGGDSSEVRELSISNEGDSTLDIMDISLAIGTGRFGFIPDSIAPIAPMLSETIRVTFVETVIGDYRDTLLIISNDPNESTIQVPLLGEVHPSLEPAIEAYPETVDFGSVIVDSCKTDSVRITNSGGGVLIVYDVSPDDAEIEFLRPSLPDSLTFAESGFYVFDYCPSVTGSLHAWIAVSSNDPIESTLMLLALGLGIRFAEYSINTEVITPNGDGLNDVLRFTIPDGVFDWRVEIFDSRGRPVVSGKLADWDGTKNGRVVPIGTYYYRVSERGQIRLSGAFSVIY
ncbi:hypothetical protein DRQ36_01960 [bacterium]|nr:MAG: hypothetical protein DRQ36_01960 [bacterium]